MNFIPIQSFKGFEDNVNMAGTDTVCNDGSWGKKKDVDNIT